MSRKKLEGPEEVVTAAETGTEISLPPAKEILRIRMELAYVRAVTNSALAFESVPDKFHRDANKRLRSLEARLAELSGKLKK